MMDKNLVAKLLYSWVDKERYATPYANPFVGRDCVYSTNGTDIFIMRPRQDILSLFAPDEIDLFGRDDDNAILDRLSDPWRECSDIVAFDLINEAIDEIPFVNDVINATVEVLCPNCEGVGHKYCEVWDDEGESELVTIPCRTCGGRGNIDEHNKIISDELIPMPGFSVSIREIMVEARTLVLIRDTMKLLGIYFCRISVNRDNEQGIVSYTPDIEGRFAIRHADGEPHPRLVIIEDPKAQNPHS